MPDLSYLISVLVNDENDVMFSPGDTIYKEGSPVNYIYFLKRGLLKIVKEQVDNDFIITLVNENNFFGLSSSFATSKFQLSAYTLVDCVVNFVDIERFRSCIRSDGRLAEKFIEIGLNVEMEIINRMISLHSKQLPGKLADTLIYFVTRIFGKEKFSFPLKRQEMADYMGVSLKSFNNTLKEFDQDGIITINKNDITINKMDILQRLSLRG